MVKHPHGPVLRKPCRGQRQGAAQATDAVPAVCAVLCLLCVLCTAQLAGKSKMGAQPAREPEILGAQSNLAQFGNVQIYING